MYSVHHSQHSKSTPASSTKITPTVVLPQLAYLYVCKNSVQSYEHNYLGVVLHRRRGLAAGHSWHLHQLLHRYPATPTTALPLGAQSYSHCGVAGKHCYPLHRLLHLATRATVLSRYAQQHRESSIHLLGNDRISHLHHVAGYVLLNPEQL